MMKKILFNTTLISGLIASLPAAAQYKPEGPSELGHPVAIVLLTVIVGLLIAIVILGSAVIGAMDIYRERIKAESSKALLVGGLIIGCLLSATGAIAQDAVTTTTPSTTITGLSQTSFYLLISVIALEILVIIALLYALKVLVGIQRKRKPKAATTLAPDGTQRKHWLEKLNDTKSLDADSEAEADMGHDFDGIHELNNPTPPWWRYGFYVSIVFAVVYLWRFQVAHSAPSQIEELAIADSAAAEAKAEYLKNAANNVDENTVIVLTDASDIEAGKKIFASTCAPCHGPEGQGVVGPNLTDDYWLHGGSIKEVFSTIKYGVPDKGMKSWKDDFSPKQLAQIASFVKSLRNSNPPNAKEPQGILEK